MKKPVLLLFSCLLAFLSKSQVTVFTTDFQNGIPSSMSIVDNDMLTVNAAVAEYNEAWICIADPEDNTDSVAASTSWFDSPDTADRWIITPALSLGSFGNAVYWNAKSQDASFPDDYYVLASTSDTQLSSFTDTLGYIQGENFEWTERTVDLSEEGYDDQTIYIAFVLRTYDGYKLYIDDISVIKEDNSGISEVAESTLKVFPNPCHDYVNIHSDFPVQKVCIYDMAGQKLIESNGTIVNTINLDKGSYRIVVYTDNRVYNKSLIKF